MYNFFFGGWGWGWLKKNGLCAPPPHQEASLFNGHIWLKYWKLALVCYHKLREITPIYMANRPTKETELFEDLSMRVYPFV